MYQSTCTNQICMFFLSLFLRCANVTFHLKVFTLFGNTHATVFEAFMKRGRDWYLLLLLQSKKNNSSKKKKILLAAKLPLTFTACRFSYCLKTTASFWMRSQKKKNLETSLCLNLMSVCEGSLRAMTFLFARKLLDTISEQQRPCGIHTCTSATSVTSMLTIHVLFH